jgi:hypothetical protein
MCGSDAAPHAARPMKRTSVLLLAALSVLGFTCGNRKPIVVNQLAHPIRVISTWDEGGSMDGELPPGGRLFLSDPPRHPRQVVISLPDGESHTFTKENAPELIGHPVTGPVVGWKVTSAGVLPLLESDLKKSDACKPN